MSQAHLDNYLDHQKDNALVFRHLVLKRMKFGIFLLRKLPMALLAGLRIRAIDEDQCAVSLPYRWLNQNPFRSTYFAVLSMAAEMSTGLAVLMYSYHSKPSISTLVVHVEGEFLKKATGLTTFRYEDVNEVRKAIEASVLTGEPQTVTCRSTGYSANNEIEAVFKITWSLKAKN